MTFVDIFAHPSFYAAICGEYNPKRFKGNIAEASIKQDTFLAKIRYFFNKYGISHIATYDVIADKGVGADQINFYKGDRAAFDKLSADADYKAVAKEAEAFRDARGYTSATLSEAQNVERDRLKSIVFVEYDDVKSRQAYVEKIVPVLDGLLDLRALLKVDGKMMNIDIYDELTSEPLGKFSMRLKEKGIKSEGKATYVRAVKR